MEQVGLACIRDFFYLLISNVRIRSCFNGLCSSDYIMFSRIYVNFIISACASRIIINDIMANWVSLIDQFVNF